MTAYQLTTQTYGDGTTDRRLPVDGLITYIFIGNAIIDTDEDLSHLVPDTLLSLTDAEVTATGLTPTFVTPVADQAAAVSGIGLEPAEDVVPDITYNVTSIFLVSSASGDKAITTASANAGQIVEIRLEAASGGSYTLAVTGGALTFNAAAEYARVVRNAADSAWNVLLLSGATVV